MSEMSGLEVLDRLALNASWASIPVIVLTSAVNLGLLPDNVDCVIKKTMRLEALLESVRRFVK